MLVCPKCDKTTRVGIHREEDGTTQRVCKKCSALFD
jgi:ribosomal protein L24